MSGRVAALVRAAGALALTVLLVAGVPLMLVTLVGNPFPAELPTVDEIRILLTQQGQGFGNFILGTLAVVVWFVWAQLVVALFVEVVATVRRAETRRLPTLPGVQAAAARLVASIALATTLATSPLAAPMIGALAFNDLAAAQPPTTQLVDYEHWSSSYASASAARAPATVASHTSAVISDLEQPQNSMSRFITADRTELWDLADAAYGDGVSWKLIARANTGFVDADGATITADTEAVAAGTHLLLPDVVAAEAVAAFGILEGAAAAEVGDGIHVVRPGDSMWSVAEQEVERRLDRDASDADVGDYWTELVAANQDVRSGAVDLIYPGDELVVPGGAAAESEPDAVDEPEAAEEPPAEAVPAHELQADAIAGVVDGPVDTGRARDATTLAPDEIAAAVSAPDADADEADDADADAYEGALTARDADTSVGGGGASAPAVGMAAMGAAILSAGVVGALRRRRDLQRRTRPAGTMSRPPSASAAAFEAALVHSSHELRESQIGLGWRMLPASAFASLRAAGPLELHADGSGRLTAVPIVETETGWQPHRIDPEIDHEADASRLVTPEPGAAVVPTTLMIGTDTASGEAVLLDLASVGTLELRGDAAAVRRVARGAVLDLAVSDRCDDLCVIAVGVGLELDDLERVRTVATFPDALALAVRCGHAAPDSTTPVVVVSTVAADEATDDIVALLNLGAMIIAPELGGVAALAIDGDHATLLPAGTPVVVAAYTDEQYRSVAELVETTGTAALQMVDVTEPMEQVLDIAGPATCPIEPGPIEVKVLGPVTIMGADSFSSLKAVDVVTYLAFHRHGVDADQIKSWVWPAFEPPSDKAFANVMSRARSGLGTDEDGSPFLSRVGADKTYRLADAVTTDFDRFRAIVDLADRAPDAATTLGLLEQALELIRGVPFTGGAASSFAWADNHVRARVEYTIDETAHRCVDLALEVGDLRVARWAVLKGLELVPGCEQCFRRRFLIASAGRNRSELRRAMADLEASAMIDLGEPEAVDLISGELLDLYHQLDQALVVGPA